MRHRLFSRSLPAILLSFVLCAADAQEDYGFTQFDVSGSPEAQQVFLRGLLQLHNFEYPDARASFQEALEIDPEITMAYWGEALSYEHSFWRRYETEKSRAVLNRLGRTPEARADRMKTQRERDYLATIEALFGEGTQDERDNAYSEALRELHEKYPEDVDAAAFYALSILVTSRGRNIPNYMRAGAITEEILDKNPLHPGGLHYNIHSYDDPVHAPLGLRAARNYNRVAPSAIHALHMGSHIYYALGMWEEGVERNTRSFEEAVARQASPDDPYGNQAYHALTWIPYGLQQMDMRAEARARIAQIAKQAAAYPDQPVHRRHYVATRASYLVDTLDWASELASVLIDHSGLSPYDVATDYYIQGLVALNANDMAGALHALETMSAGGAADMPANAPLRRANVAPVLLRLALQGQIALAEGDTDAAIALVSEAEQLEAALPAEYGPAVPVQPMAELLGDVYRAAGNGEKAREYYERSLQRAVGRIRSLNGLKALDAPRMSSSR